MNNFLKLLVENDPLYTDVKRYSTLMTNIYFNTIEFKISKVAYFKFLPM